MNASIKFSLKPVPPFRLDLTAWALRRRPNNLIDRWDGEAYRRVLVMNGYPAEVAVRQSGPSDSPRIHVSLTSQRIASHMKASQRPHWNACWDYRSTSRTSIALLRPTSN
jgi:hypothetical protein